MTIETTEFNHRGLCYRRPRTSQKGRTAMFIKIVIWIIVVLVAGLTGAQFIAKPKR